MKTLLSVVLALSTAASLPAQSTAPAGSPSAPPSQSPLSVLNDAERTHLESTHQKTLDAYPQLLQEEQKIQSDIDAVRSGSSSLTGPQVMQEFVAHRQELEADMVKVDPTIQPVLDKIHAAGVKMRSATAAPSPPQ